MTRAAAEFYAFSGLQSDAPVRGNEATAVFHTMLPGQHDLHGGMTTAELGTTVCGTTFTTNHNAAKPEAAIFGSTRVLHKILKDCGRMGPSLRYDATRISIHDPLPWREAFDT